MGILQHRSIDELKKFKPEKLKNVQGAQIEDLKNCRAQVLKCSRVEKLNSVLQNMTSCNAEKLKRCDETNDRLNSVLMDCDAICSVPAPRSDYEG